MLNLVNCFIYVVVVVVVVVFLAGFCGKGMFGVRFKERERERERGREREREREKEKGVINTNVHTLFAVS